MSHPTPPRPAAASDSAPAPRELPGDLPGELPDDPPSPDPSVADDPPPRFDLAALRLGALGLALVLTIAITMARLFVGGPPSVEDLRAQAGVERPDIREQPWERTLR
jgi:glutamate transport system substrate-binding protein